MRWLVHHSALRGGETGKGEGDGDGVVVGFSKLEQLRENLDALEKGPLGTDLLDALERAWRAAKPDADHYWQLPMAYGYDTQAVLFGKTNTD
jgi:aflatoxin B1 aldehyde reductase